MKHNQDNTAIFDCESLYALHILSHLLTTMNVTFYNVSKSNLCITMPESLASSQLVETLQNTLYEVSNIVLVQSSLSTKYKIICYNDTDCEHAYNLYTDSLQLWFELHATLQLIGEVTSDFGNVISIRYDKSYSELKHMLTKSLQDSELFDSIEVIYHKIR